MYIRNQNVVLRCINNSFFLIDITENYLEKKFDLYEINEIGVFLWNRMEKEVTVEKLKTELIKEIDSEVSEEDIEKDIISFLETLRRRNFINEV